MFIKEITGSDLEESLGQIKIIDVRTTHEYNMGHIEGAINIPYDEILDHLDEIDKDVPYIIHCRTNQRSQYAAVSLMHAG